ncbi:unnamed protein product, partial [Effrenium voratum]
RRFVTTELRGDQAWFRFLMSMLLHMGAYGIVDRASGRPGYQAALSRAFNDFTAWRKSMRIASSQKRFNYYGLFKEEFGTFLNCKGYNARVVSEWLMEVLNRTGINRYFGLSVAESAAWTVRQAADMECAGRTYLLAYRKLNIISMRRSDLCWVVTPKWHEQIRASCIHLQMKIKCELRSDEVTCPAAKTLPLVPWIPGVSRFLDAAVQLVRLHSGTLLRLAEALNGVGLEQLQEQLAAKAGEAVNTAMNLWEDWEAKEDQEVAKELHSQVEQAMPELQGVVGGLVSGLNQLLCRVQGFDGTWVGQADGEARCVIKDAVLVWHWGQDSELEIWSPESISTLLEGEIFRGKKLANGSTWA